MVQAPQVLGECARVCRVRAVWCRCSARVRRTRARSRLDARGRGGPYGDDGTGGAGADACAFSSTKAANTVAWVVVSNARMPLTTGGQGHFGMLCSAVSYSPTPCRVQYHRRWRA